MSLGGDKGSSKLSFYFFLRHHLENCLISVKNLIFLYCGLEGLVLWRLVGLGQQEDYLLESSGLRAERNTVSSLWIVFDYQKHRDQ